MKNNNEIKKLNNKGFSLVELIIVIAIIAVLIGVLAPQYLKYVDKSRKSADLDTVDSMISAIEIYSSDPDNAVVTGTLTCVAGKVTPSGAAGTAGTVADALSNAGISIDSSKQLMKYSKYQKWVITFAEDGITFDSDGATLKADLGR